MEKVLEILQEVVAKNNQKFFNGTERKEISCWDYLNWLAHIKLLVVAVIFSFIIFLIRYFGKMDQLNLVIMLIVITLFFIFFCIAIYFYYDKKLFSNDFAYLASLFIALCVILFSLYIEMDLRRFGVLYLFALVIFYPACFFIDCCVGLWPFFREENWIKPKVRQAKRIFKVQLDFLKIIKNKEVSEEVSLDDLIAVRRAFALSSSQIRTRFVHSAVILAIGGGGASLFSIFLELMGVVLPRERYVILAVFILIVFFIYVPAVKAQEEIDDYLACLDFAIDRLRKDNGAR